MPRIKRSASVIDEEPPEKKVPVGPLKREGVIRKSACAGCLILLANWMPEDGEPPWCYDFDVGDLNGISVGGGTVKRTCIRCSHHRKYCYSDALLDRRSLNLHLAWENSPRDNVKIKGVQWSIRRSLGVAAKYFKPGSVNATQIEEVMFREYSQSLDQAISSFGAFIEGYEEEMRTGDDAGFKDTVRNNLGMVKSIFNKAQRYSPRRFASGTMEGLGLI